MSAAGRLLRRIDPTELAAARRDPVDPTALHVASRIVADVRAGGLEALRAHAERLGDLAPGAPLLLGREQLEAALGALPAAARALLERTAARVAAFAEAQRAALRTVEVALPGGRAGHALVPVERAGGYAPGGRHPLPSSVIMTVVPARVAGVASVWVASPRPAPATLAAAALAGADGVLAAGGAQAVAALAFGVEGLAPVDVLVGPGNRFVTAAKQLVSGRVGIDALAGPSELVVLADDGADPGTVAADLLAQAEHDADALPLLVTPSERLARAVEQELALQLAGLDDPTAARALANGGVVVVRSLDQALAVCDRLAPEHLELYCADAERLAARVRHAGAVFVGGGAAEVLGDYGAGPNHVLPTGGAARHTGGLSVLTFLRVRTWLAIDDPAAARGLMEDARDLARMEGLEGHARAAERRL